jgi:hypothetical protein
MALLRAVFLGWALVSLTGCMSDPGWTETGHSLGSSYPDHQDDAAWDQTFAQEHRQQEQAKALEQGKKPPSPDQSPDPSVWGFY